MRPTANLDTYSCTTPPNVTHRRNTFLRVWRTWLPDKKHTLMVSEPHNRSGSVVLVRLSPVCCHYVKPLFGLFMGKIGEGGSENRVLSPGISRAGRSFPKSRKVEYNAHGGRRDTRHRSSTSDIAS